MTTAEVLQRLRRFLLVMTVMLFGGAVVELWLVEHTEDTLQFIPFVLCGLGTLAALAALVRPRRATLWALRSSMVLVACGSLLGVYLHLDGNIGFQKEVSPNAPAGEILWGALGGGNPLLAPGILVVAAALALASTYRQATEGEDAKG